MCGTLAIIILFFVAYKKKSIGEKFWKTKDGKNVPGGIGFFWLIIIIVSLLGLFQCNKAEAGDVGDWFPYVDISIGIENTFHVSPMCEEGGYNDRLTSNLKIAAGVWVHHDGTFWIELYGRHHSCGFNKDHYRYDSGGINFAKRFYMPWARR